ncbi:MAG TPA: class I SAM-dependent methyltransferase, partial [Firmicutes bacterium]|nr:class I SAM-dependent methyltransferase [Bacillota bacterium]
MSQYFSNDFSLKNDNFIINYEILGKNLTFYSNNGIFSKNRIDKGSDIFIKYLLTLNLVGKVLDYGSGIGIIGICLNLFFKELDVTYCDVNYRCLELNKQNLKKYDLNGL